MQLTLHTDYALRVLIYLTLHADKWVTIEELTGFFQISRNHLVKIVHKLGILGFITTLRGKGGGIRLARPAGQINIGDVVRSVEGHFHIVECFNQNKPGQCAVQSVCGLTALFGKAVGEFMAVLDAVSLEQMVSKNQGQWAGPPLRSG